MIHPDGLGALMLYNHAIQRRAMQMKMKFFRVLL